MGGFFPFWEWKTIECLPEKQKGGDAFLLWIMGKRRGGREKTRRWDAKVFLFIPSPLLLWATSTDRKHWGSTLGKVVIGLEKVRELLVKQWLTLVKHGSLQRTCTAVTSYRTWQGMRSSGRDKRQREKLFLCVWLRNSRGWEITLWAKDPDGHSQMDIHKGSNICTRYSKESLGDWRESKSQHWGAKLDTPCKQRLTEGEHWSCMPSLSIKK